MDASNKGRPFFYLAMKLENQFQEKIFIEWLETKVASRPDINS
jgi:hypothetical protein